MPVYDLTETVTPPGYGEPSAERVAETDALLTAFAAITDHKTYWPAYGAVEARMNAEMRMGRSAEAERIRVEMNRINRSIKPMLNAQYAAIKTYSLAELAERAAAATKQHEAA
ncbi:hypothetical protein [Devosia sp. 2618]|uniref:hypothetical protein n=1 Tax=Devosia sp. 2618 TaxID=3156454 RepID=UPI003396D657